MEDLEMLWLLDANPERKASMAQEIAARWVPSAPPPREGRGSGHVTHAGGSFGGGGGGAAGVEGGEGGDGRYILSRHDVGKWVEIYQNWRKGTGDEGPNTVQVKLRKHLGGQQFQVQFQNSRVLPELDFSRLDFGLVSYARPPISQIWPQSGSPNMGLPGVGAWPQSEGVVGARGGGWGVGEGCAAKAGVAPVDFSSINDIDAFRRYAEQVADVAIKSTALHRLYDLFQLIHSPDAPVQHRQMDRDKPSTQFSNCVLGFHQLEVKQPEFNQKIRELVRTNKLWHGLSGSRELKKPTWVVYELLRQIGVRPQKHCRGPKEHDPGVCACVCACLCVCILKRQLHSAL